MPPDGRGAQARDPPMGREPGPSAPRQKGRPPVPLPGAPASLSTVLRPVADMGLAERTQERPLVQAHGAERGLLHPHREEPQCSPVFCSLCLEPK